MDRATWMRAETCNDIQKQGRREAVGLVVLERFTVIKFWMDETSSVALALKTGVPTYQVEDDEGRTHLLIHLPIEEEDENRWCLWRPDHAGFDSRSIFKGALVEE